MNLRLPALCTAALLVPVAFAADPRVALRTALTHHASFDSAFAADFSRGDRALHFAGVPKGQP
ncbi:MAG: hypothetical protein FJ399_13020, partial [Verrucomicrobia bacterium]|nr:hypothetical protein [Verrucomicrobiota bacterium]